MVFGSPARRAVGSRGAAARRTAWPRGRAVRHLVEGGVLGREGRVRLDVDAGAVLELIALLGDLSLEVGQVLEVVRVDLTGGQGLVRQHEVVELPDLQVDAGGGGQVLVDEL